jgi:hypothetical protein
VESIRRSRLVVAGAAIMALVLATGCYAQLPLAHDPSYRPTSWEPIMGVVTEDGTEVMFDQPARLESGRVVGRVDGSRYVAELRQIQRLLVGHKALDKPKTVIFGAALITVFAVFFASIGLD